MSVEVMKQALDALEVWKDSLSDEAAVPAWRFSIVGDPAITALRAAIAEASMQRLTDVQQAIETAVADQATYGMGITLGGKRIHPASIYKEQEPVAWMCRDEDLMRRGYSKFSSERSGYWDIPVFTHPPRREWVGLTEVDPSVEQLDQIIDLLARTHVRISARELLRVWIVAYTRAIEAKLKEKNA